MSEELDEYDWPAVEQRLAFLLYQMATKVIGERKVDALAADSAVNWRGVPMPIGKLSY
jgi:hypothetical protein